MRLHFLLPIAAALTLSACNEMIPLQRQAAVTAPAPVAQPAPNCCCQQPAAAPTCPQPTQTVVVIREPAPRKHHVVYREGTESGRPRVIHADEGYDGGEARAFAYRTQRGYAPPPSYDGQVLIEDGPRAVIRREESETTSESVRYSEDSSGGYQRGGCSGGCRNSWNAAGYTQDGYLTWPGKQ